MLLVVAATGRQGNAVCTAALAAGRPVRGLVRDPSSAAARRLAQAGVELVQGDLDDPASLEPALQDVRRVFAALPMHPGRAAREVARGEALADAIARARVEHLVYSAALWTDRPSGVPHLESKLRVRSRIAALGLPATVLEPAGFMENLLHPQTVARVRKGTLVTPLPCDLPQALVAVRDIGAAALWCFDHAEVAIGRSYPLHGDTLAPRAQAAAIGEWLGRPMDCARLHPLLVRLFLGRDLARMFRFIAERAPLPPASDLPLPWTPFASWLAGVAYAR